MHEEGTQKTVQSASVIRGNPDKQLQSIIADVVESQHKLATYSLAITRYVTGYVTKAERSKMQDLWQEVSSRASIYSTSRVWSLQGQ